MFDFDVNFSSYLLGAGQSELDPTQMAVRAVIGKVDVDVRDGIKTVRIELAG